MAISYKVFNKGISLVPNSSSTNSEFGDLENVSGILYLYGASNDQILSASVQATVTNKLLKTGSVNFVDTSDITKKLTFDLSGFTTATNRTWIVPNVSDTFVGLTATQTLTNKTLTAPILNSATADTITGITGAQFLLQSATNQNLSLQAQGTGVVLLESLTVDATTLSGILTLTGGAGTLLVQSGSNQTFNLNSQGTGLLNLQNQGNTIGTIDSNGLLMATGKNIRLVANSQTVTLAAHASASASYTINTPAAAPTSNTAWIYNGTDYVWGTAGGWSVTTVATLTGGGTIANSATQGQQVFRVQGNSGAVTLSTTPFANTPNDGVTVRLIGTSNINTVTISNNDASGGCILNGNCTLGQFNSIELQYFTSSARWQEISRNF